MNSIIGVPHISQGIHIHKKSDQKHTLRRDAVPSRAAGALPRRKVPIAHDDCHRFGYVVVVIEATPSKKYFSPRCGPERGNHHRHFYVTPLAASAKAIIHTTDKSDQILKEKKPTESRERGGRRSPQAAAVVVTVWRPLLTSCWYWFFFHFGAL
jgi:hypothetical protein